MGRILVTDDEQGLRDALEVLISGMGHTVRLAESESEAKTALEQQDFDLVVTDLRLEPDGNGINVVRCARGLQHPPEVIVMTAYGTREDAQAAIQEGASFYLEKGPHLAADIRVLVSQSIKKRQLQADNEHLRRTLVKKYDVGGIAAKSEPMQEVLDLVERIAPLKTTVLVTGESGTGKERVAKALHFSASRSEGPFIPLNCGAIPENLIESELFGHAKGAFTGADLLKRGLFEAAADGTIFLDEIGELPMSLQPKLLRVLQERTFKRVGEVEERPMTARVIAATNRDLEAEVKAGRFREDLYFRLNVVELDLPALRQRREDIPLLINTFVQKFADEYQRDVQGFEPEALEKLLEFRYPGNVRQLENIVERAVALARGGRIGVSQLPKEVRQSASEPVRVFTLAQDDDPFPDGGIDFEQLVEEFEYGLISRALEKSGGVKTKAAELLGLSFRQFRYKLSKIEKLRAQTSAEDRSTVRRSGEDASDAKERV